MAHGAVYLRRMPVREEEHIVLLPVDQIASIVAHRETLQVTTNAGDRYTIVCRLKDVETRLDPARFVRLSRSAIVSIDAIRHVRPSPSSGTYCVTLGNSQTVAVSRIQGRLLRERLLTL